MNSYIVFFIAVSIVQRQWALPIATGKQNAIMMGAVLMSAGMTESYYLLTLLIIPAVDLPRCFFAKESVENVGDTSQKTNGWYIAMDFFVLLATIVCVAVIAGSGVGIVGWTLYAVGALLAVCGDVFFMLKKKHSRESRLSWIFPVALIPLAIVMKDFLPTHVMAIVCISLTASVILGALDVFRHKDILGIHMQKK